MIENIIETFYEKSILHKAILFIILLIFVIVLISCLVIGFIFGIYRIDNPWINSIISIFLGILVTACWNIGVYFYESNHGWMTGNWTLTIYDNNNQMIKQDLYIVVHRKNDISADIIRTFPDNDAELGRKWIFRGRLINNTKLIGYYWSLKDGSQSCGAQFLLNVEKDATGQPIKGHTFRGSYIKANFPNVDNTGKFVLSEDQIPKTTITWQKPAENMNAYKTLLTKSQKN